MKSTQNSICVLSFFVLLWGCGMGTSSDRIVTHFLSVDKLTFEPYGSASFSEFAVEDKNDLWVLAEKISTRTRTLVESGGPPVYIPFRYTLNFNDGTVERATGSFFFYSNRIHVTFDYSNDVGFMGSPSITILLESGSEDPLFQKLRDHFISEEVVLEPWTSPLTE